MRLMKRSIINPVLVVSGSLVALTGLFLLFDYESDFAYGVHQICAIVLVIFGVIHILTNWKALSISLKGRLSVWVLLAILAVSLVILVLTGEFVSD